MRAALTNGRGIVTPQGVVLDLEVAGVGHRGVARVLDLAIVSAAIAAVSAFAGLFDETTATILQLIFGAVSYTHLTLPTICSV